MSLINQGIIDNVEASYIEIYLREKKIQRTDDEMGISIKDWINNLLSDKKIDEDAFEEFLFEELFLGKRKLIRIYQLDNMKKIKYLEDWQKKISENYNVNDLDFNAILDTRVNSSETRKVAAVHYDENEKGELTRLQILFMCFIQVNNGNGYRDTCAYIPVDINFTQKIMILKAWNRKGVIEEYRADVLTDNIKKSMSLIFGVTTRNFMIKHKQVLYNMSKQLVDDVHNKIPAFIQIPDLQKCIDEFEQLVFSELSITNVREDEKGKKVIPKGVMEFSDEIRKAIERLSISDYFYDRSYDKIWNMGIDAIIAKIKFNDNENILTSLSGEDSETPIFCTKTFMYLKKSMEDSKLVEILWIVKNRSKGTLNIRYNATEEEYLGVLIKFGVRYKEEDLKDVMEIYKTYETRTFKNITSNDKRNVG